MHLARLAISVGTGGRRRRRAADPLRRDAQNTVQPRPSSERHPGTHRIGRRFSLRQEKIKHLPRSLAASLEYKAALSMAYSTGLLVSEVVGH